MGIAVKLANLNFSSNKLGTVTPASGEEAREFVIPGEISVSSPVDYTFAKQGQWYISQNKNIDQSTAVAYLTFQSTRGIVRFDYYIDSEPNCDYGYIKTSSGTELVYVSGTDYGYVDVNVEDGENVVILEYTKDSSNNYGNDEFKVKVADVCTDTTPPPSVTSITISGNTDTNATYETYSYSYEPSDAEHNISWSIGPADPEYICPDYYWFPSENKIQMRIPFVDSGDVKFVTLYAQDLLTQENNYIDISVNRQWRPKVLTASDFKADMSVASTGQMGSAYRHYLPFSSWHNVKDYHTNWRMGLYIHRDNCPGEYLNPNIDLKDVYGNSVKPIIQEKSDFESKYSTTLIPKKCRRITVYHNQPELVISSYVEQNDGKGNSATLFSQGWIPADTPKSKDVPSNVRGSCENLKNASNFLILSCANATSQNSDIPSYLRGVVPFGLKITFEYALDAWIQTNVYDSIGKEMKIVFNADYTYNKCYLYLQYWKGSTTSQQQTTELIDYSGTGSYLSNVAIGRYIYSTCYIGGSAIGTGYTGQSFTFRCNSGGSSSSITNTTVSYRIIIKGIAITNAGYSSWSAIPDDYKVTF